MKMVIAFLRLILMGHGDVLRVIIAQKTMKLVSVTHRLNHVIQDTSVVQILQTVQMKKMFVKSIK
jgi:hypothetical protein